jgi:hypothetical protein
MKTLIHIGFAVLLGAVVIVYPSREAQGLSVLSSERGPGATSQSVPSGFSEDDINLLQSAAERAPAYSKQTLGQENNFHSVGQNCEFHGKNIGSKGAGHVSPNADALSIH